MGRSSNESVRSGIAFNPLESNTGIGYDDCKPFVLIAHVNTDVLVFLVQECVSDFYSSKSKEYPLREQVLFSQSSDQASSLSDPENQ